MGTNRRDRVSRINCLTNELDALYHQAARKLGISDSVSMTLYMIYEMGDGCLLYDIYNGGGISKQTINSAIRKLERDGILFLKQDKGKAKRVFLTQKGRVYLKETAERLAEAECNAFKNWTDDEFETYIRLNQKFNISFKEEIEKMKGKDL